MFSSLGSVSKKYDQFRNCRRMPGHHRILSAQTLKRQYGFFSSSAKLFFKLQYCHFERTADVHTISSVQAFHTDNRLICNEESNTEKSEALKNQLFETALEYVQKYGWTLDALTLAADKINVPYSNFSDLKENGVLHLIQYHINTSNKKFVQKALINASELGAMSLEHKLSTLIRWRLEFNIPYMSRWSDALALQMSFLGLSSIVHQLLYIADEICFLAGYQSTDIDWYVHRICVVLLYVGTELFMVTDASKNYTDTWGFLDRRLEDLFVATKTQHDIFTLLCSIYTVLNNSIHR